MRPSELWLIALVAALPACSQLAAPDAPMNDERASDPTEAVSQRMNMNNYIIQELHPPSDQEAVIEFTPENDRPAEDIATQYGLTLEDVFGNGRFAIFGGPGIDPELLEADEDIRHAQLNDPVQFHGQDLTFGFHEGGWSRSTGYSQATLENLMLSNLHEHARGKGVRILVVDTGVDAEHHAYAKQLELIDVELYGLGSVEPGLQQPGITPAAYGHGTHVTGCVVQAAPGATVIPVRVLDHEGVGSLRDFMMALYAASDPQLDIDIINLSLSTAESLPIVNAVVAELRASGIALVAASGNSGGRNPSPLAINPDVLGVAAVDVDDHLPNFSGAGLDITLAAPGIDILSAYPGGDTAIGTGTSFATPFVAGSIAVMMEAVGTPHAIAACSLLYEDAMRVYPLIGTQHGRVNPYQSLLSNRWRESTEIAVDVMR